MYLSWIRNIEDWCISRQLWWGHRIPIWYDKNKKIYVGLNKLDIIKKYKLKYEEDINIVIGTPRRAWKNVCLQAKNCCS